MLAQTLVTDLFTAALATGGDMAEIFAEHTERCGIGMVNGLVERANWGIDYGCGLRVICGHNAVYAYTNRLTRDDLLTLAREAAEIGRAHV